MFLNDVFEAYEITNALAEDMIWIQYANLDTVATLLTSIRLFNIRSNEYLIGNYETVWKDSSIFEPYRDVVKPPSFSTDSLGCHHATVYTWSPDEGCLTEWTVSFGKKGELTIIRRVITDGLGYTFRWS